MHARDGGMTGQAATSAGGADGRPNQVSGETLSAVVNSIGPKIRHLRKQWSLSLQQLADRSDVSTAAIHKVEQGTMVPTITTLLKLAAALEQPVAYFVDEELESPPYVVFTPASERRSIYTPHEGLTLEGISGPYGQYFVATAIAEVAPGAGSGQSPLHHAGEELIHMLSGRLDVDVSGQTFQLRKGDSIHFRTDHEHRWRNPTKHPARAVWTALRPS
ncbi:MAG: cupin domain-containing protein [Acidimicrobiaceae bacterium]|nr:cupin domain-containing protein [Acidimicrobiaceae bacterium]MYK77901.1 cupin domain-containing protein [Acidimicrobiaceae bacterium]